MRVEFLITEYALSERTIHVLFFRKVSLRDELQTLRAMKARAMKS
jgi:hypothetical protein